MMMMMDDWAGVLGMAEALMVAVMAERRGR